MNTRHWHQRSIRSAETPYVAAKPSASHLRPLPPSCTSPKPSDTCRSGCRPRASKPPLPASPSSLTALPPRPQNPETISGQTHRPAALHSPSHLLSLRPPPRRLRRGRLADSASAPTPPLSRRDTPPVPLAAPSKRAPIAAHNIRPLRLSRPSQMPRPRSRLPRCLFQLLAVRSRIKDFVGTLVPLHPQLLPPLQRRPRAVRQHRHAAQRLHVHGRFERRNRLRPFHSAHRQRLFAVHRLHRAAHHRRMHNCRVQHPLHARVLPVNSFARANILQVVARSIFPDVAPFAPRFELQLLFFRHFQFRCRFRERSIAQLLPRFLVHHGVQLR